jgi:heat shock protein HtpX
MNNVSGYKGQKIWWLLTIFFIIVIGAGYAFSYYFESPGILYFAVVFSSLMSIFSYWFSDKLVLKMAGAKKAEESDYPKLYKSVQELCLTANLPLPGIYVIEEMQPNAFATGRDKNHAVVAVTKGLLSKLTDQEVKAVLGHELTHIQNKDMLFQTMVVVLVGFVSMISRIFMWGSISKNNRRDGGITALIGLVFAILAPLAATLIQLAVSRQREFAADAGSAYLMANPEIMVSALMKISSDNTPAKMANGATAHLFISNPFKGGEIAKIFMTHPTLEDRIKNLRNLKI